MTKLSSRFLLALSLAVWPGVKIPGSTSVARAQQNAVVPTQATEMSVRHFLQRTLERDETTHYVVAFRDLDGDGASEAIVYLIGHPWCGSGGCRMLVLKRTDDSWKVVVHTTVTWPPIYVLSNTSHGWRSIGVWVQGGGIQPGYAAELAFDGTTYPSNPTRPPARRLEGKPAGDIVITDIQQAKPLYESGR